MAKAKKTNNEAAEISEEQMDAIAEQAADTALGKISKLLKGAKPSEEKEDDEEEEGDDEEDTDDSDGDDDSDDGDDDSDDSDDEEESDDEDSEDGDDDSSDDDDEEESDDEDGDDEDESEEDGDDADDSDDEDSDDEEGDDDEDDGNELDAVQVELDAIPKSVLKQAKTDSEATAEPEMKKELASYFVRRGLDAKDAKEMVSELEGKDLKLCYSEYYSRFIDVDGEVHDIDEVYKAKRMVNGKEKTVYCCNGAVMVDGKCIVNPKIKAPKDKGKDEEAAPNKKKGKRGRPPGKKNKKK